jgi:2-polyprenyl-3-methyl-5-hydroxy-6-metoxy-1,4-benzoquinol methylase
MYNWREKQIENDPNNHQLQEKLNDFIIERRSIVNDWKEVILPACKGKRVLDVGAIGHNKKRVKGPEWKHDLIKWSSEYVKGVDILADMVEWINKKGYNFACMDATGDGNLNELYDVVFMGDIIEHVSDLKGLLEFAKRHLNDNGKILISTPNPYFYDSVFRYFRTSNYPRDNMEHTCWFTPSNINELCYRTGLYMTHIYGWELPTENKVLKYFLPVELSVYTYIYELEKNSI